MVRFPTFRLTRYFSVLSLVLIAVAGLVLGVYARHLAIQQMTALAQQHNEAMGQVFINALWPRFADLSRGASGKSPEALRTEADQLNLQTQASALMRNSQIIKIKVYSRDGLTVFSSDPRQTGESKLGNAGFVSALAGNTVSELTHRNQFDSFEGTRSEVDVISSYLPVRQDSQNDAVLELYQDVTPFMRDLDQVLFNVVFTGASVMVLLYLAQLVVVRYAQRLLQRQQTRLIRANRQLDDRVAERTAELAAANAQLHEEIAERKRAEVRLEHLAHHDPLTSLPNRLAFTEHLQRSIVQAQAARTQIAVLFVDLDRFKEVNDALGHTVGDELLTQIARRLGGQLRPGDLLARLGGDEFVCVVENMGSPDDAARVATLLIERIANPLALGVHALQISASIGIALYPNDGQDTDNLLRAADTAMYEAKRKGRNTYHFYTPEMTQHARERVQMERLLRQAIANRELEVHYQVKMALGQPHQPSGAEALVRWTSPELGAVPPVRFIPIAEETGFIVELGSWVLRTACQQAARWRAQGLEIPRISVNLSVRQLERADIVETVRHALHESGLPAHVLELEITESVIMHADNAIAALEQLTALGVQLAIDDFGTGYSSLAYLKLLPINTLKVDRSFVVGIGDSLGDESIIRAVISMAQSLHMHTVAEGVETAQQLAFLQKEGCEQVQGYLFGKPQSAADFANCWGMLQPTTATLSNQ